MKFRIKWKYRHQIKFETVVSSPQKHVQVLLKQPKCVDPGFCQQQPEYQVASPSNPIREAPK